mmetsp:Transcript_34034/g.38786  ORF Transcript_34034/g.38786 Transcript_34034/m.38786 type:complete len:197 (-) Transcript_34034:846-1436(-)
MKLLLLPSMFVHLFSLRRKESCQLTLSSTLLLPLLLPQVLQCNYDPLSLQLLHFFDAKKRKPSVDAAVDAFAAIAATSGAAMVLYKDPVLVKDLECTITQMGTKDLQATKYIILNAVDAQDLTIVLSKEVTKVVEKKKCGTEESGNWTFVTTICSNENGAYIRLCLNTEKAKVFVNYQSRHKDRKEFPVLFGICET